MYMLWKSTFCLINQHIHHLTYLAVLVLVKTFKFYFISTCQLYNTVLSIIVTIFYMRSSICISLIAGKFRHLLTSPHFLHTPAPDNHFSTLFLIFLRVHTRGTMQYLGFSFWLISLGIMSRSISDVTNGSIASPGWVTFYLSVSHLIFSLHNFTED